MHMQNNANQANNNTQLQMMKMQQMNNQQNFKLEVAEEVVEQPAITPQHPEVGLQNQGGV